MSQTIEIEVKNKIAETDFREVVTFNSVYALKFAFDGEWESFPQRVAVAVWEKGCAERIFSGTECEMPLVASPDCDCVMLGVYAAAGERRIASTFVRLPCRAGAHGTPSAKSDSLQEQMLAMIGEKDWSVFDKKVESGVYSAVRVSETGFVTEGLKSFEVGEPGQAAPNGGLAVGGLFFLRSGEGYRPYVKAESGLQPFDLEGGKLAHALTVGGKRFDGSAAVSLSADDLSLSRVAVSGSYNDLSDKPNVAVSSVNGKTGDVVLSKESLGLGALTDHRQFPLSSGVSAGGDVNDYRDSGVYFIRADENFPVLNMPTSSKNSGPLDGEWILLVVNFADADSNVIQLAISSRGDNAVRLRTFAGSFSAWKTVI